MPSTSRIPRWNRTPPTDKLDSCPLKPPRKSVTRRRIAAASIIIGVCLTLFSVRWANSMAGPSKAVGLSDGRLAGCPNTPNCVSTQASRANQFVEPIPYDGPAVDAWEKLVNVIRSMPRCRIVKLEERYLHAEFRSFVFGFIDDIEAAIDEEAKQIHLRSASRVGYSDLGVNRQRIERIRQRYTAL
jgi:uncharacterized protein (DUF1499 family)